MKRNAYSSSYNYKKRKFKDVDVTENPSLLSNILEFKDLSTKHEKKINHIEKNLRDAKQEFHHCRTVFLKRINNMRILTIVNALQEELATKGISKRSRDLTEELGILQKYVIVQIADFIEKRIEADTEQNKIPIND